MVSEVDLICAPQAAMEGYKLSRTMEDRAARRHLVTATATDIIIVEHARDEGPRIVCVTSANFVNSRSRICATEMDQHRRSTITFPTVQSHDWWRPVTPKLRGDVMSASFTNQTLAQIERCRTTTVAASTTRRSCAATGRKSGACTCQDGVKPDACRTRPEYTARRKARSSRPLAGIEGDVRAALSWGRDEGHPRMTGNIGTVILRCSLSSLEG
jgi:hypothetical protein